MSQPISQKPHLHEDDLNERADVERTHLAEWASGVTFKPQADDFEIHDSAELGPRLRSFLRALELPGKVDNHPHPPRRFRECLANRRKGYSLVQIPGPKHARFHHSKGDAYIIPIQIIDGNPTVSGTLLREGKRLYMKANEEVIIEPKLRLLFVLL